MSSHFSGAFVNNPEVVEPFTDTSIKILLWLALGLVVVSIAVLIYCNKDKIQTTCCPKSEESDQTELLSTP